MADHFAKQGFVVHMLDLRGFGYRFIEKWGLKIK